MRIYQFTRYELAEGVVGDKAYFIHRALGVPCIRQRHVQSAHPFVPLGVQVGGIARKEHGTHFVVCFHVEYGIESAVIVRQIQLVFYVLGK